MSHDPSSQRLRPFALNWLTSSASQVNGCVKDCVIQTGKNVGCYNEADPQGSVNCICGDKRGDFTGQAGSCIANGCPDQLGGAPALLDELCTKGLKDGHW